VKIATHLEYEMKYKIEKNVPLPSNGVRSANSELWQTLQRMEVGDSIKVELNKGAEVYKAAKFFGKKFKTLDFKDGSPRPRRVWRTS
jgi:hypothetical protein